MGPDCVGCEDYCEGSSFYSRSDVRPQEGFEQRGDIM